MNTTGRRPGSSEAQWAFASDAGFKSASASPSASAFGGGPDGPRVGASWGPFWIEAELGRGASARVYRARVAESGDLALKVLLNPSEPARQRLAREAWLVGQLQHPGIVALRGAGEVGRTPFVLYDLVSGARPLSSAWLNLSTEKRVDLVTQVATAVGYAHSCGVTHRDLKPANVLVDEDGDPRVVDFGLATHAEVDALTRSGAWVGTPSYMAPEQFEATRAGQTPAVDVWSLGVLLYEALTERLPFHGASVVQLATRVMDTAPTPPRRLNAEVTPQVEAVCLRALAKDPAARFPDARAFALALRAA
ncbi:MAG: serine/threonine protein kinase, partial [Planctomycetes bacterium]|nr:serine/threonine protein kinase [Planctomycetota bacterium]